MNKYYFIIFLVFFIVFLTILSFIDEPQVPYLDELHETAEVKGEIVQKQEEKPLEELVLPHTSFYEETSQGIIQTVFYNLDSASLGNVIRTNAYPVDSIITACKLDESFCMDLEIISRVSKDGEASVSKNIFDQFIDFGGSIQLRILPNDEFYEE